MWPAVGLFAIFAVVACVAAACDASAADIAAQDVGDMSERMSAMEQRLENDSKAMAQVINDHAADIEHLKKKGALDFALGQ
jgi:exonuclease VII large subunit